MTSSRRAFEQQTTALKAEDRAACRSASRVPAYRGRRHQRARKAEIEARVVAYEHGEVQLIDAADIFSEARHLAP